MTTEPYPYPAYPPLRRPSLGGAIFRFLMGTAFGISVGVNLLILLAIGSVWMMRPTTSDEGALREQYLAGTRGNANKIAVVQIDGVIIEGLLEYPRRQIEMAAEDPQVKAVVVKINSPGGSITASDDLYHRLLWLRDGDPKKGTVAKPLVASMDSIATSGGYYVAMPAKHVVADRTTITGSIGVYAAFPNLSELAEKWGVKMNVIKRGEVKDSGSMFHEMTPQERRLWQDLIDHAYDQFLQVVREGRGDKLKYELRAVIPEETREIPGAGVGEQVEFVRRLADGGVFTADKALKYGLVDQVGYFDDAVAVAAKQAGLGETYQVVSYARPVTLWSLLFGSDSSAKAFDPAKLADGVIPRVWFLLPESGLAGVLSSTASRIR